MIIDSSRDKLFQAIAYFVNNTSFCHKTKLYKLLFFLDFRHFQATGRSVTGLHYNAWPNGPVPVSLQDEINDDGGELTRKFAIEKIPFKDNKERVEFSPNFEIDMDCFTRREVRLLEELVLEFKHAKAQDMIDATHMENDPWHTIYEEQGDRQGLIPYNLALRSADKEEMLDIIREREEFISYFGG